MYRVTPEQRTDAALAFLAAIEQAGYDTMFYAARNELLSENCWETGRIEPAYKIWVAQYPKVTYPTQQQPDYSGRCDAWQYTNQGVVNGIGGGTDLVVCYFKKEPAKPKNAAAAPPVASAPPTQEDRLYTAVEETVTAKERVNLRSAATTKSEIVAQLYNGQTLIRTGVGSNGWSRLEYNGQTVYAITSYLTTDTEYTPAPTPDVVHGNTFTAKSDEVTAKERVNLRALPTTDSEIVGELHSGEFLQRTAVSDKGWSRLDYNGQAVYAVTSYLSNEVVQIIPDNDIVHGNTFTAQNDQVTAKEYVNLRALPTTDSEAVGTLAAGQYLQRTAVSDKGWSRLIYNGQTVYAVTSFLTN